MVTPGHPAGFGGKHDSADNLDGGLLRDGGGNGIGTDRAGA